MLKEKMKELLTKKQVAIAILSSFLLAILPWHVQFSRMAAEANVGLFFFSLGVYMYIKAINKNSWWLVGSAVAFGLSMYSYLSFRVISFIMITFLLFFYRLPHLLLLLFL